MKIRIKFEKTGVMKFIGHLDVMRYFQKCMRRANIDIAYSEGFSPHQIMSFAAPLGVGITSSGEYLDIEVHSTESSDKSINALNAVMVDGMKVTSYRRLSDSDKKAMTMVAAADYLLTIKEGYSLPNIDYVSELNNFFVLPNEILITKKTKKSEKVMDLKQLVYDFKIEDGEYGPSFYLKVSTGSTDNLKPELVLETFLTSLGIEWNPNAIQIHRIDVYGNQDGTFISLGEIGDCIYD